MVPHLHVRSAVALKLTVSELCFARGFSFAAAQEAAEIELVISRGSTITSRTSAGDTFDRGGGALQLASTPRTTPVFVATDTDVAMDCVSLAAPAAVFCELLGARELPAALRRVTESADVFPLVTEATTPALAAVLDEILQGGASARTRLLWHEGKALELLALAASELDDVTSAGKRSLLSADQRARLERVERRLRARLDEEPTLAELARIAGMSETRLKAAFRAHFDEPIFAHLRRLRMAEARRLLIEEGHLSVADVAARVGYENASKFAAAFKREHGMPPSTL